MFLGNGSVDTLNRTVFVVWHFRVHYRKVGISGPCPLGVRSTKPVQVQQAEESDVLGLAEE